jgi:hypothetical protein
MLASEPVVFWARPHVPSGSVPGDGVHVIFLLQPGVNCGHYFLLIGEKIGAKERTPWLFYGCGPFSRNRPRLLPVAASATKSRPENFVNLENCFCRGSARIRHKIRFTHSQNRSQKSLGCNSRVNLPENTFLDSSFDKVFQVICDVRVPFLDGPPSGRKQHDITQPDSRDVLGLLDAGLNTTLNGGLNADSIPYSRYGQVSSPIYLLYNDGFKEFLTARSNRINRALGASQPACELIGAEMQKAFL